MSTNHIEHSIDILLVEDNPGDVRLTQEALAEAKMANRLHIARDGVQAISFLRKQDPYQDVPRPGLVLLDLNLPLKSGLEVLEIIKHDPDLKRIPVVILTSSKADEDIARSYGSHANCYITKPVDLTKFFNVVQGIDEFWLAIVQLPNGPKP